MLDSATKQEESCGVLPLLDEGRRNLSWFPKPMRDFHASTVSTACFSSRETASGISASYSHPEKAAGGLRTEASSPVTWPWLGTASSGFDSGL